jgi:anti-sigma regulatory factor (Ser/Thr protein kinase)
MLEHYNLTYRLTNVILDGTASEAASQLVFDDGWSALARVGFSGATLNGAIDLSRAAFSAGNDNHKHVIELFARTSTPRQVCEEALTCYGGRFDGRRGQDFIFSTPRLELWMVRSWDCLGDEFQLFIQRFEKALRQHGFGEKYPKVLVKAFSEMVENVMRHSSRTEGDSAIGVVGYHVVEGSADFVVADLGQGVLSSLSGNTDWAHLQDEQTALVAAARDGATQFKGEEKGFGFKMVFKSFLERAGVLALRSGDGIAILRGNMDSKEITTCSCAVVPGLRVSISISLNGEAKEIPL